MFTYIFIYLYKYYSRTHLSKEAIPAITVLNKRPCPQLRDQQRKKRQLEYKSQQQKKKYKKTPLLYQSWQNGMFKCVVFHQLIFHSGKHLPSMPIQAMG